MRKLALLLLLACSVASAQIAPVVQTGGVSVGNTTQPPQPTTIFSQACNGGTGGIVGQAYGGVLCGAPVITNPYQESATDRSGAITTGGVSQQIAAVNPIRRRFVIQNPCSATTQGIATAESLFVQFTAAAGPTNGSFELTPCGMYETGTDVVGTGAVNIYTATTGHKFTAKEW